MRIVVDTNILISILINPQSKLTDILFGAPSRQFISPTYIITEIDRYWGKITKYSRLNGKDLIDFYRVIMDRITIVPDSVIDELVRTKAMSLTEDVDPDDLWFVALSIQYGAPLWTGDKKLHKGVNKKGYQYIYSTKELLEIL